MDEFVKKAFENAVDASKMSEFKAYERAILDDLDIILDTTAIQVGWDRMEQLSKVTVTNNVADILADFMRSCIIIGFHLGYKEGKMAE